MGQSYAFGMPLVRLMARVATGVWLVTGEAGVTSTPSTRVAEQSRGIWCRKVSYGRCEEPHDHVHTVVKTLRPCACGHRRCRGSPCGHDCEHRPTHRSPIMGSPSATVEGGQTTLFLLFSYSALSVKKFYKNFYAP